MTDLARRLALVNRGYGPTETSYTTHTHLPRGAKGRIGRLIANTRLYMLRGYRVEPGEIESVLLEQPGISQAAVVLHEDSAGEKCLVAYLVGPNEDSADTIQSELHGSLRMQLPEYMIPSAYV